MTSPTIVHVGGQIETFVHLPITIVVVVIALLDAKKVALATVGRIVSDVAVDVFIANETGIELALAFHALHDGIGGGLASLIAAATMLRVAFEIENLVDQAIAIVIDAIAKRFFGNGIALGIAQRFAFVFASVFDLAIDIVIARSAAIDDAEFVLAHGIRVGDFANVAAESTIERIVVEVGVTRIGIDEDVVEGGIEDAACTAAARSGRARGTSRPGRRVFAIETIRFGGASKGAGHNAREQREE